MSRNFTEENLALTRQDIMDFLDADRAPDIPAKKPGDLPTRGKTRQTPDKLRAALQAGGHRKDEIDKVIGDWDSYL